MDKLRFTQLKTMVQLDHINSHDMPQLYFHLDDLKWLFQQAEKAEYLEASLRTIAKDMNEKELRELIEFASNALED